MADKPVKSLLIASALSGRPLVPAALVDQQRALSWFQKINADADTTINHRSYLKKYAHPFVKFDLDSGDKFLAGSLETFRNRMRVDLARRKRHVKRRSPSSLRFAKLTRLENKE